METRTVPNRHGSLAICKPFPLRANKQNLPIVLSLTSTVFEFQANQFLDPSELRQHMNMS